MAKNDRSNNAGNNSDGTDRTSATSGDALNTGSSIADAGTVAAAPGARESLDAESDQAKALQRDKEATGGAIRAEDNTEAGPGQPAEAAPAGTDPSVSEKVKVKTTGPFILQDPYSLDTIDNSDNGSNDEGVVRTSFINDRLAAGQLTEI